MLLRKFAALKDEHVGDLSQVPVLQSVRYVIFAHKYQKTRNFFSLFYSLPSNLRIFARRAQEMSDPIPPFDPISPLGI